MRRAFLLRYGIKRTPKIFPVKVDFPLPTAPKAESRFNPQGSDYRLADHYLDRRNPPNLVGQTVRLQELIAHYEVYLDKVIIVAGWVWQARQSKDTLLFLSIVDGSTPKFLQVVIESTAPNFAEVKKAKRGYCVRLRGRLVKSPAVGQPFELKLSGEGFEFVEVLGTCDDDKYPLSGGKINMETLRTLAHLRPRTQVHGSIIRVKNSLAFATHQFFQNNGFLYIHTPLITGADCEGAGDMFQVTTMLPSSGLVKDIPQKDGHIDYSKEFFKKATNLTVSGQLALENFSSALSNVYTFGPTFRAEVSHTHRHIAEFWMIEPEISFADVYDVMECAEAYVQFCIRFALRNNRDDLELLQEKVKPGLLPYLEKLVEGPFAKVSYTEAIAILKKVIDKGVVFENDVEWGCDLNSEHERYLTDHIFGKPLIVYNYPKDIKSFYMRANPDGKTVAAFDMLVPDVGEIIGGSQREERLEKLEARIKELNMPLENYWWYLDLRKHGTVPHGGFGLGF